MRGVDQAFGDIAEPPRPARLAFDALGIAERVGAIDGDDTGGAAFDDETLPAIGELKAVPAPLGAEIGGKVFRRQQAAAGAAADGGDRAGLHKPAGEARCWAAARSTLGDAVFAFEARNFRFASRAT